MNPDDFPLPVPELARKYPELRALCNIGMLESDESVQKIICDITELVRRLDFKARKYVNSDN